MLNRKKRLSRAVARKKLQPRRTHGPLYEISRMKSSNIISLIKKIKIDSILVKFYRGECLGSPHTGYGGALKRFNASPYNQSSKQFRSVSTNHPSFEEKITVSMADLFVKLNSCMLSMFVTRNIKITGSKNSVVVAT